MADYYVATTGNDTTGDGSSGNPYATPGKALGVAVAGSAGWNIYVKAGTYTLTSDTANVAGGKLDFTHTGATTTVNRMIGYTTTITDGGQFTLTAKTGSSVTLVIFNNANSYNELHNCEIVGNATSGACAISGAGRSNRALNIYIRAFSGGGFHIVEILNNFTLMGFRISGGSTSSFSALNIGSPTANASFGIVEGNAGRGIDIGGSGSIVLRNVISANHTGANGYGVFVQSVNEIHAENVVCYGNAQSGFHQFASTSTLTCFNCVSYGNSVYGWNYNAVGSLVCVNCSGHSNTSGNFANTPSTNIGFATLTGSPFSGAGSLDFTPGSELKSQSALFPYLRNAGLSTSYADIGAIQAAASGGGTKAYVFGA